MLQKPIQEEITSDILDLINSEDIILLILAICASNEVEQGEKIEKISERVGQVLLGDLPQNLFAKSLHENAELSLETAEAIARDVEKYIFSQMLPVKEFLDSFYKEESMPAGNLGGTEAETESNKKSIPEKSEIAEIEKPSKQDSYRESIE
jgi:hypothetical protein